MSLARTHSIALVGVEGHPVEIEVDIENGLVGLLLVGLPDMALREARDRIRSAIVNSREKWPHRRITVGLSPASLPKRGSSFDLGIAVAILSAAGDVPPGRVGGLMFLGELGLDGRLRPVRGVLPAVAAAAAAGFRAVAVPAENAAEACLVPGMRVVAASSLGALLVWLRGRARSQEAAGTGGAARAAATTATGIAGVRVFEGGTLPRPGLHPPGGTGPGPVRGRDLADVVGQPTARRAAEICAAGGHHLLLLGPAGRGQDHAGRAPAHGAAAAGARTPRWRSPRSTRSPGPCPPEARCWPSRHSARRITPRPGLRSWAAAQARCTLARHRSRTTASCSSMRPRSSPGTSSTRSASRWSLARSCWPGPG